MTITLVNYGYWCYYDYIPPSTMLTTPDITVAHQPPPTLHQMWMSCRKVLPPWATPQTRTKSTSSFQSGFYAMPVHAHSRQCVPSLTRDRLDLNGDSLISFKEFLRPIAGVARSLSHAVATVGMMLSGLFASFL
jgi:hypothetical protein